MATMQLQITAGTTGPNSHTYKSSAQANTTAVDADVAVLVADGATPTQAHVTTLNADWTILKAGITAQSSSVLIQISSTLTKNQLREILRNIESWVIDGSTFLSS